MSAARARWRRRSKPTCERQLQPESIEVRDDSHLHAGHAGAREGGHFTVRLRGRLASAGLQPRGPASPRV
jgi:stress-induced morphogen